MEVSKASIQKAVANNIISEQQGLALYNFFQEENQHTPLLPSRIFCTT